MFKKITTTVVSSVILSNVACAGDSDVSPELPPVTVDKPDFMKYMKVSLDGRLRYEARNQQGSDFSHALTARVRPGITFLPDQPLSFYVESEHTLALVDDYTALNSQLTPFVAGNTAIGDPENNELNQAYVKYSKDGFTAKVGRQRIIFDNAAFIGNVGWRQNEQTFDAVSLAYKKGDMALNYAYINRVNRIFGTDGVGPVQAFEGDAHLLNASLAQGDNKYVAYAYLMNFDRGAVVGNNTFGGYADIKTAYGSFHLEGAYQTESDDSPLDYDAYYAHTSFSKKVGAVTYTAGLEYLGDDFRTPLATVHAFNGFADKFILERIGLTNNLDGLSDFYLRAATKVGGVVVKGALHQFRDDSFSETYGWEADVVVVKALSDNTKLIGKFAYFFGDDDGPAATSSDIGQLSVQLDYKF